MVLRGAAARNYMAARRFDLYQGIEESVISEVELTSS